MKKSKILGLLFVIFAFAISAVYAEDRVIWERDGDVDALLADAATLNGQALPATGGTLPIAGVASSPSLVSLPANAGNDWMKTPTSSGADDHEAEIFYFKGKVRVKKSGSDYWTPVYKRMRLQVGDEILTYKNSKLAAKYDQQYKDLIYVDEKTHAVLENIEPTRIFIERGRMFHYLDAVVKNRNYQVANKSTTLGIRGTHALTGFNPLTGESSFGNFPTDDGHSSFVDICLNNGGGAECLQLEEGQGGNFGGGNGFGQGGVNQLSQDEIDESQQNLEELENSDPNFGSRNKKNNSGNTLPPTGGGFSNPGFIDPAGPGNIGGGNQGFDPSLDSLNLFDELPEPLFEDQHDEVCRFKDDCGDPAGFA